jgi:antitoxin MazE
MRKPRKAARAGWSKAAKLIAGLGEDQLLMGDFANAVDRELEW